MVSHWGKDVRSLRRRSLSWHWRWQEESPRLSSLRPYGGCVKLKFKPEHEYVSQKPQGFFGSHRDYKWIIGMYRISQVYLLIGKALWILHSYSHYFRKEGIQVPPNAPSPFKQSDLVSGDDCEKEVAVTITWVSGSLYQVICEQSAYHWWENLE